MVGCNLAVNQKGVFNGEFESFGRKSQNMSGRTGFVSVFENMISKRRVLQNYVKCPKDLPGL